MRQKIQLHLEDLSRSSVEIEAAALISINGLMIATTLPLYMDTDHIGGVFAGALQWGRKATKKFADGMFEQIIIKCAKSQIILTHVGEEVVLTVIIKSDANLDRHFSCINHTIAKITPLIYRRAILA